MKKTLIGLLFAMLAFTPFAGTIPSAKAGAPLAEHSAFRTVSNPAVYWHVNGKRYPFPNAETYFSWFGSFDDVRVVHDSYLEVYPLATENVTYRPGAKLVKIQTAPEVYVVERGGVLRHVASESVARELYGTDWNSKVDDIPDVFFANYAIGETIYSSYGYDVVGHYQSVQYPDQSLKDGRSDSGSDLTGSLYFLANRTNITSGQSVYLYAGYSGILPSGGRTEIQDDRTGTVVKSCHNTTSYDMMDFSFCDMTVYPTHNNNENSVRYSVIVRDASGLIIASLQGPTIYFIDAGNSLTLATPVITSPYQDQIFTNYPRTLTTQWSGPAKFHTVNYEICHVGNTSCTNMSSFELQNFDSSYTFTVGGGDNRFRLRVKSQDEYGNRSAWSDWVYFNFNTSGQLIDNGGLSQNDALNHIYELRLETSATSVIPGSVVKLTANAFNVGNWNYTGYRIEIRDTRNGSVVKTCYDQSWCVADVTVNKLNDENSAYYEARLYDQNGTYLMIKFSPEIHFTS